MTFSIVAYDRDTKRVGVCQGTGAFMVASRCPQVDNGVAVTSQWQSDWRHGLRAVDLAVSGLDPRVVLSALEKTDPFFRYRQIGIVTDTGEVAAHTGDYPGKRYNGHLVGDGFTVLGNGIVGPDVLENMKTSWEGGGEHAFEDRMLRALEAGLKAGGEGRTHLSASLISGSRDNRRHHIDIRVDLVTEGQDSIRDLRRLYDTYAPLEEYYSDYWLDHPETLGNEWIEMGSPSSDAIQIVR